MYLSPSWLQGTSLTPGTFYRVKRRTGLVLPVAYSSCTSVSDNLVHISQIGDFSSNLEACFSFIPLPLPPEPSLPEKECSRGSCPGPSLHPEACLRTFEQNNQCLCCADARSPILRTEITEYKQHIVSQKSIYFSNIFSQPTFRCREDVVWGEGEME